MDFKLNSASRLDDYKTIKVDTIEELLKIIESNKNPIVVDINPEPTITIYDSWLE